MRLTYDRRLLPQLTALFRHRRVLVAHSEKTVLSFEKHCGLANPVDYKYYLDLRRYGSAHTLALVLALSALLCYLTGVITSATLFLILVPVGNADF